MAQKYGVGFFFFFHFVNCSFSFLIVWVVVGWLFFSTGTLSLHVSLSPWDLALLHPNILFSVKALSWFPWGQMETRCLLFGYIFKFSNLAWISINKSVSCWTDKSHHLFFKYYFLGLFLQTSALMILWKWERWRIVYFYCCMRTWCSWKFWKKVSVSNTRIKII